MYNFRLTDLTDTSWNIEPLYFRFLVLIFCCFASDLTNFLTLLFCLSKLTSYHIYSLGPNQAPLRDYLTWAIWITTLPLLTNSWLVQSMDIDPARGATPYQRCGEVIDLCRASAPLFNVANSLNYCICHDQYFGARVLSSQYLPHCGGTRWSSVALGLPCRSGSWKPLGLRVAPVNNALTTIPQHRQYHLLKPCIDSISRGLWFEHCYSGSDPFYKLTPSL